MVLDGWRQEASGGKTIQGHKFHIKGHGWILILSREGQKQKKPVKSVRDLYVYIRSSQEKRQVHDYCDGSERGG